jgi:hypothetical protein
MTPEPRSVEEALETLRRSIFGLAAGAAALAFLRSELTRLRGIEEAADKYLDLDGGYLPPSPYLAALHAALARPDRQEEGDG